MMAASRSLAASKSGIEYRCGFSAHSGMGGMEPTVLDELEPTAAAAGLAGLFELALPEAAACWDELDWPLRLGPDAMW